MTASFLFDSKSSNSIEEPTCSSLQSNNCKSCKKTVSHGELSREHVKSIIFLHIFILYGISYILPWALNFYSFGIFDANFIIVFSYICFAEFDWHGLSNFYYIFPVCIYLDHIHKETSNLIMFFFKYFQSFLLSKNINIVNYNREKLLLILSWYL